MPTATALSIADAGYLKLAAKGRAAARVAEPDWRLEHRRPFWLPKRAVSYAVSQFFHGEIATADFCDLIADRVDSNAARAFLATQAADERRHAGFYRRYLDRIGAPGPVSPALATAFDSVRAWAGPPAAVMLAVHIVLEGMSLRLQQSTDRWLPCPLFADISRIVARDEARHLAFGKHYLSRTLPDLRLQQRLDIFRWLRGLWDGVADDVCRRLAPIGLISSAYRVSAWRHEEWALCCDDLRALGLFTADEAVRFLACGSEPHR